MKKIAIVLVVCVGLWYYFIGGRKLDETMVRQYYEKSARAMLARDADLMCKQLSRKVVIESKTVMMGQSMDSSHDYKEACDAQHKSFEMLQEVGDRSGGALALEFDYQLDAIDVAANRKSATITGTQVLNMGPMMQFKTSFTHRLERELGNVRLVRSDDVTVVRMGGAGSMRQSDFFRK